MTCKLKCPVCPWCGQRLRYRNGEHFVLRCPNLDCKWEMIGTKEMWQALIQAKQDLEIALTAIKEIAEECGCLMAALKSTGFESVVETFDKNIRKKLEQIEHKE